MFEGCGNFFESSEGMMSGTLTAQPGRLDPAVWNKNLEALYGVDSKTAQQLDDRVDDDHIRIEPARNGEPTLKVKLPDGKEIYLNSRYDPGNEAEKFVDSLDLEKNFVFIFSGIGLGYHIRSLFDRAGSQTFVIVFEPEPDIIRRALWQIDFSKEIKKSRLIFLMDSNKGLMYEKLSPLSSTMILGTSIQAMTYTKQWHNDFHTQMRSFFTDFMAFHRMSFVTMLGNSRITQANVANNLVSYVCCPTIDSLYRKFEGYPAIVVSAGPSLSRNVELLKQAKGKAVIIAVQTVFKMLRNLGIEPDFVTSLDYSQVSKRFFEGTEDFGKIQLIAEPKAAWPVLDVYTGRKRLLQNEFADMCLGDMTIQRKGLKAGSTVAHLSFYLAEYLGANPIVLMGQDLAFSDNLYYAPGNVVHDIWSVELNRFFTIEMKEWERIVRNRPILRKVKDIHDRTIFTDEQMFTYLQQFERDFAQTSATVIDATEGGSKKRNTIPMTLAQALEKYAQKTIPPENFELGENFKWFDPQPLENLARQIQLRIDDVEKFKQLCEKTRDLTVQLQGLLDKPAEFNRLVIQIDEIRSIVNTHMRSLKMVCYISPLAELRRFISDRHMDADETSIDTERAKNQLKRDVAYMKALIEGCDDLTNLLTEALDRIEQARKEHNDDDQ
jgi:hypothetical protein